DQPLRHTPEREVDRFALLLVVQRRRRCGFLEGRPVLVVDPEIERVVRHHPQHHAVAEHAGLAEHAPHGDTAKRRELLSDEFAKAVAGIHRRHAKCGMTSETKSSRPSTSCNPSPWIKTS